MATYQANITKSIEPAMANPATLQQASASTRAAIETLGKGVASSYEQYVAQDVGSFTQEAREQAAKFYTTNQEAQDAGELASYMQKKVAPGIFKEAEQLSTSPFPEEQAAGMERLASFGAELARLKAAEQGGMKTERFIANVDMITRKAIAKYPGLADQIRQQVSKVTGVEGADEFTRQRWIQRELNPRETKNPALEAANRDMMTFIVNRGAASEQEALMMRDTDPAAYYAAIDKGRNEVRNEVVSKQAKALQDATVVATEAEANAAWPTIQAGYNAGANKVLGNLAATNELKELSNMLLVGVGSPKFDAAALEVKAKGVINNIKGALDANLFAWKQSTREQMRRSGKAGSELEKQQLDRIDTLHKETVDMYANEKTAPYLLNILNMKEYEKYTFEQKRAVQTSAASLLSMTGNAAAVGAYFAGGGSRAQVEKSNPELFKLIDNTVNLVIGGGSMASQEAYSNMAKIQQYMVEAKKDGAPVTNNTSLTPKEVKVATQLNYEQMKDYLKTTDSAKNLSLEDVNVISTAFTTTAKTGEKFQELGKDYTRLKENIAALPDEAKEVLKVNGSNTAVSVIADLQRDKTAIENKYGVKLQIGVTPSGKLGVVIPPRASVPAQRRALTTAEMQAAAAPVFAEQKLMQAAKEFENKAVPRMVTLSNTRAIVTGEELKAVSNDYANAINTNQPYAGFYNAQAQPVTPTATSSTTQTSDLDTQVKGALQKIKEIDPNLNTDYVFNAYQKATTEQKKILAEKFKSNTISQSDLNTK